jgi:hypothetical protein
MAELQPCYVPEATRETFNLPSEGWYAMDKDGEIIRELGCHSSIIGIEQAILKAGDRLPPGHFGSKATPRSKLGQ